MKNKYVILPSKMFHDEYFGGRKYYIEFLEEFGNIIQIVPTSFEVFDDLLDSCKLLVLPGGGDIEPLKYGSRPGMWVGSPDPYLEYYDKVLLPIAIKKKVPVLGVCRGFQSIITYYGGSLVQHLPDHPYSESWGDLVHNVNRINVNGAHSSIKVNSLHHQGAYASQVPACFSVIATSAKDHLCEAIVHIDDKVMGVQWHPEVLPFDEWLFDWVTKMMIS